MSPAKYSTPPRQGTYGRELFTRLVSYGTQYGQTALMVPCVTCHAEIGEPCRKSHIRPTHTLVDSGLPHGERTETAYQFCQIMTYQHALRLNSANPHARWSWDCIPHQCGTLGPHVRRDCTSAFKWAAR